jgi:HD-like signal output (HDOD) protein
MESSDTVVLDERYQTARNATGDFIAELEATLTGDGVELPSLPSVALSIREALARENADVGRITALIGSDPALAARLLKVANCALFHPGNKPIMDLRTAVMRLGFKMVRNLSMSIAAQQVFLGYSTRAIAPYVNEVWRHSIHVATLAHLLTTQTSDVSDEEAFLAGLLHEIGKLYILIRAQNHSDLFRDAHAFRAVLGDCQARIGAAIMRTWEFPEPLTNAVADHERSALECTKPVSLTDIVAVANHLAESFEAATDGNLLIETLPNFGALNLDRETIVWMISASATDAQFLQEALAS